MTSIQSPSEVGEISCSQAFSLLRDESYSVLVDVRTTAEWTYVGMPDLPTVGKKPLFLQWQIFPTMTVDAEFVPRLQAELAASGTPQDAPLLFLCRSGLRSLAAGKAMAAAGHTRCYNIVGGFEGPPDAKQHRGNVSGWKASALPWTQS